MKFLLLLLVLLCIPVSAAGPTPQQARDILAVAYGQYHGPRTLLDDPPQIHIVTQDEIRELANCTQHCPNILGLYKEETGFVYLDNSVDFSTVYATTILLHEYIHYFQSKTRGLIRDMGLSEQDMCLEFIEREREAYRIQAHVLAKAGEYHLAQSVLRTAGQLPGCGPSL